MPRTHMVWKKTVSLPNRVAQWPEMPGKRSNPKPATAENASTMLLGQTVAGMIESVATEKDDEKSE